MAKTVQKGNLFISIEAKNIGFLKGLQDTVDTELGGMETLAAHAVADALEAVPEGYGIKDIRIQPFGGMKDNVLATVVAEKSV